MTITYNKWGMATTFWIWILSSYGVLQGSHIEPARGHVLGKCTQDNHHTDNQYTNKSNVSCQIYVECYLMRANKHENYYYEQNQLNNHLFMSFATQNNGIAILSRYRKRNSTTRAKVKKWKRRDLEMHCNLIWRTQEILPFCPHHEHHHVKFPAPVVNLVLTLSLTSADAEIVRHASRCTLWLLTFAAKVQNFTLSGENPATPLTKFSPLWLQLKWTQWRI